MVSPTFPGTGDVIAGKLKIVRQLGSGGMGAVFEVEHTLTKHRRALKLLHGELARSKPIVTRFLREASAAGRIGNPHVVETFDAGQLDSGEPYIVMELLSGRTLADLIAERSTLTLSDACDILLQACDGVAAAHAAGIVHRDLKPENLFLLDGPKPFVKILDFGISKFDPELTGAKGITMEGSAMGTPFYMPPEQVRGERDIDAQADVYALGVVLYECVTGAKPFFAETLPHLAVLIYEGRYTPPSVQRPGLPTRCDEVIARAMASERLKRFASIRDLSQALQQLSSDASALAHGATMLLGPPSSGQSGRSSATAAAGTPDSASEKAPAIISPPAEATGVAAQTDAAFAKTQAGVPKKSNALPAVVAGALLVAGGGVWALTRSEPAPDPIPAAASGTSVTAEPSATSVRLAEPPSLPSAPPAAPSQAASAPDPRPVSSSLKRTPAAKPSAPAAPASSSLAKKHGLSEENPFEK